MTAASTPPSSIRAMASSGVKAVTCRCDRLLGKPLPQRWIWASTICIAALRLLSHLGRAPQPLQSGKANDNALRCQQTLAADGGPVFGADYEQRHFSHFLARREWEREHQRSAPA